MKKKPLFLFFVLLLLELGGCTPSDIPIASEPDTFVPSEETGTLAEPPTQSESAAESLCVDGTGQTKDAYTSLEAAIAALPDTGGQITVCGDVTLGGSGARLDLPKKSGTVRITGQRGARLRIAYGVALGFDCEIDEMELVNISAREGFISADGHSLTIGENVTTSRENTERWLTILGGNKTDTRTSYDSHLIIRSGTYRYIFGGNCSAPFDGNSTVEVSGITVGKLSARCEKGPFNGTSVLIADLRGGRTVTASEFLEKPSEFLVDDGYRVTLNGTTYAQAEDTSLSIEGPYAPAKGNPPGNVGFLSNATGNDNNDGRSDTSPKALQGKAGGKGMRALLDGGGIFVVCGNFNISSSETWDYGGKVTITGSYNGKDYRDYSANTGIFKVKDGKTLTVKSEMALDALLLQTGASSVLHITNNTVFSASETVYVIDAQTGGAGKCTLVVDEGAVAILAQPVLEYFSVTGEGQLIVYDPVSQSVVCADILKERENGQSG